MLGHAAFECFDQGRFGHREAPAAALLNRLKDDLEVG
jgi:hypothetical protein